MMRLVKLSTALLGPILFLTILFFFHPEGLPKEANAF